MQQQTSEWLAFRRERIGASDAPVIMGDSPWCTPYRRWQEKMGLVEQPAQTYVMRRGLEGEDVARAKFEDYFGISVSPTVLIHPDIEWMIASMDGVSADGDIGVEIKHAGAEDHSTAKNGKVPTKYYAQLQHQHEVGRFKTLYYCSIGKDDEFVCFEVPRDDIYIAGLLQKEKAFYGCISNFESPDLSDGDFVDSSDPFVERSAAAWLEVHRKLKALEAREKELRTELIRAAGDRPTVVGGVKVNSYMRRGNVDYASIPELKGVELDGYRKSATKCWKISEK